MNKIQIEINRILASWNPINVPDEIVEVEYISYVDEIISVSINKNEIFNLLEDIVSNRMGLNYDKNSNKHKAEIENIAGLIYKQTSVVNTY